MLRIHRYSAASRYVESLAYMLKDKESLMQKADITHYSIAVLAGGWSDEAEISLQSGGECLRALKQAGFSKVELFDIKNLDFMKLNHTIIVQWILLFI